MKKKNTKNFLKNLGNNFLKTKTLKNREQIFKKSSKLSQPKTPTDNF